MLLLAVALAAAAAAVAAPGRASWVADGAVGQRRHPPRMLLAAALVSVTAVAAVRLQGPHLGVVVVLAAATAGVLRAVERSQADRQAQQRRHRVVDFCEALVGELRAGQPTGRALDRAAEVWEECRTVASASRLGASVPDALRRLGQLPGADSVRRLAGAWEVSAGTGSGLAPAVEQVLRTVRAEDRTARSVRAELASARATARLVTALPVVVLLAAQGIGARPWQFLLGTWAGVACLGAGVALAFTGLSWIDRIAARSTEVGS